MLVKFGDDLPEIETVLPYGISNRAKSPHFTDQMSLYATQKRKKMTLDKTEIYKNSSNIYHPK
jgi:acyl-homoserine lactone acylase PvdQ